MGPLRIVRGLTVALGSCLGAACHADDALPQTVVYRAGEDGYHTFRIPAIVATPAGTLLAFAEGRKHDSEDAGDIDVVLRRSTDGGRSWSALQVVWDDGPNTCGNPCPLVERQSGTIWLPLTHNLGRDREWQILAGTSRGTRTVWIAKSNDDGATWNPPVEITRDVKRPEWTWYATGPGVGIQLAGGRLIVPCDNYLAGGKTKQSHVIYSDDRGASWRIGGVVGPDCNESQAVELADGSLLLNARSYRPDHRRLVAISHDGGESFGEPQADAALVEPICQASILRVPGEGGGIVFSNPASLRREKLTVRLSRDEGRTWSHALVLHDGPAAYSCLVALPDSTLGCLYERGEKSPYEELVFARFTVAALLQSSRDGER